MAIGSQSPRSGARSVQSVMILGIGLFGLLAASLASFLVEKDLEKDLDPQMAQIDDRLSRIEELLKNLQPKSLPDSKESRNDN